MINRQWVVADQGQTIAQLEAAQVALGNTVIWSDADNMRTLVDVPSGSSLLAGLNALTYKGAIDCSSNPNFPAADAGDLYIASVAGKIGGASGVAVETQDVFICKTDGTSAGTQSQVGNAWDVLQGNLLGPIPVKASGAEVNTGTDDAKFVTAKAVEDSDYAKTAAITITQAETNSSITPIADGTYTVGLGVNSNGTITVAKGLITGAQVAS